VVLLAVLVVRSVLRPETDPLAAADPDWPVVRRRSQHAARPVPVGQSPQDGQR
jgi:hypothetical protein